MQLKIQVSTGKEYLFLASNLRTAVWSWKLTVLEYNSKSCWETENSCVGLEINSAGIQQLTPAEKLRTAERGWKITVLEYNSYPLLEFRNGKLLNTFVQQYTEHAIISSIASIPVTCRKVISEPLNRICFTRYGRKNLNPLTPKSDQLLISPYNISPESNIEFMRIKEMTNNL